MDQHGAPVARAFVLREALTPGVRLQEFGRATSTDGRFQIALPPAEYRIALALPDRNFRSPAQQVTVRAGEAITMAYVLQLEQ